MACIYREINMCKRTNNICPWVSWCSKINGWKERAGMEKYCKYLQKKEAPDGYYIVEFEKRGYLYVTVGNETVKIKNPFDLIPEYVRLYKSKGDWKIKKEKEKENEE